MSVTQFNICLVVFMTFIIANVTAKPTYDGYIAPTGDETVDRFDYDYYQSPYSEPLTASRLRRLRRGYYFVDDGFITPIAASAVPTAHRRQDAVGDSVDRNVQYTPLVKYKHTRTKHKKLFVPNLFG